MRRRKLLRSVQFLQLTTKYYNAMQPTRGSNQFYGMHIRGSQVLTLHTTIDGGTSKFNEYTSDSTTCSYNIAL